MPRLTGPLYSAAASGLFGGIIEFRMIGNKAVATRPKHISRGIGPIQAANANRFKVAKDQWKLLSAATKLTWKNRAASLHLTGYQLYIREYIRQAITPPGQPTLPA